MAIEPGMTALLMGLAGGPHCALMCGAACAGAGRLGRHGLALFQIGRLAGYTAMGALAAWTLQGLGWLGGASAALRPLWSFVHLAAMALGLVLVLQARQPAWLERAGRRLWQGARQRWPAGQAPLWIGMLWALMPCGLLQSALMTAALAGAPLAGARAMALFALGSAVSLWAAPWLLLRWSAWAVGGPARVSGAAAALSGWSTRLAGAVLLVGSGWALWRGLVHEQAPWCLPR